MQILFLRIYFKILRTLGLGDKLFYKIKSGRNKGFKYRIGFGNDYLFGTYEEDAIEKISEHISPNDIIYDLGANAGYFSLAFSRKTNNKIYAFEPSRPVFNILKTHIKENNVTNVIPMNIAITDQKRELTFTDHASKVGNTYISESKNYNESIDAYTIEGNSIDNVCLHEKSILPPNVIKIDVEGAEYDVLLGARATIEKYSPVLLLATHERHVKGIRDKCLALCKEMNYEVLPLDDLKNGGGLEDFLLLPKKVAQPAS